MKYAYGVWNRCGGEWISFHILRQQNISQKPAIGRISLNTLLFPSGHNGYILMKTYEAVKKVRYDVHRTTEVYLRVTTVTFLNKLMKRDKSMQKE